MSNRPPAILEHAAILADATRCRVLALLEGHELTVSELRAVLRLPQSTVSRHLKLLADGGWVRARREATSHYYELDLDGVEPAARELWRVVSPEMVDSAAHREDRRRFERVLAARRSRSQEFFSATASAWDRLRDELFGTRLDFAALPGLLDPRSVVGDLACGTGRVAQALAPFVDRVIAVDGSKAMLAAAQSRLAGVASVELREGSLEALPIGDGELDAATLFLALHHLPDPARAFLEAARVLKPGGRLLVVDMLAHDREAYRQQMGHVWLGFAPEQVDRYLDAAGFGFTRHRTMPPDADASGPALFATTATAHVHTTTTGKKRRRPPTTPRLTKERP